MLTFFSKKKEKKKKKKEDKMFVGSQWLVPTCQAHKATKS